MNSCRAAVESKGWLGNDAETLALSSSCCGQWEPDCFPDGQVPAPETVEGEQHHSWFYNSQKPEPYSQKGLNPEPSTLCFFCACWGGTGKQSQL